MSTEEPLREDVQVPDVDTQLPDAKAPPEGPKAEVGRKRPRIDLSALTGGGERKRGKSMFGVLLNTLNKAKAEDKERNASDAAKRRQLIDQRLQTKLKKDADSVRQAEQAKKDRALANRREEELQLKDSIYKLRRSRVSQLANFLSTSDTVPPLDAEPDSTKEFSLESFPPPRSHPPPLFYMPAVLTPSQEAFLSKRKVQVKEAVDKEWESYREERTKTLDEIMEVRRGIAAVQDSIAAEKERSNGDAQSKTDGGVANGVSNGNGDAKENELMDVDDGSGEKAAKKDATPATMEGDEDEY